MPVSLARKSHYRANATAPQSSAALRNVGPGADLDGLSTLRGVDPASPADQLEAPTSARSPLARYEFGEVSHSLGSETSGLDNLCIHTITTKSWNLETAARKYAAAGVGGMSIWLDAARGFKGAMSEAGQMVRDEGLDIVSYVRGGFFTALEGGDRQKAISENKKIIDEAAELGAPLIVLVVGATPGQSLFDSRKQIAEGLAAVLPHAQAGGVKLGIEPLHPMYADSRSAVSTVAQANAICDALDHPYIGITLDVYHVWWDDELEAQIKIAGEKDRLFSFHICDWKDQPDDLLNDRVLMGEGVIDIPQIRQWVKASGFSGYQEVEIFSNRYWAMDQDEYLLKIKEAYLSLS